MGAEPTAETLCISNIPQTVFSVKVSLYKAVLCQNWLFDKETEQNEKVRLVAAAGGFQRAVCGHLLVDLKLLFRWYP
jgi:hypothetical protein